MTARFRLYKRAFVSRPLSLIVDGRWLEPKPLALPRHRLRCAHISGVSVLEKAQPPQPVELEPGWFRLRDKSETAQTFLRRALECRLYGPPVAVKGDGLLFPTLYRRICSAPAYCEMTLDMGQNVGNSSAVHPEFGHNSWRTNSTERYRGQGGVLSAAKEAP